MMMHSLALMQSEVHLLRGELATLSKRRRAKKTRLRHGGSLSVGEADDIQAQNEVNAQISRKRSIVVVVRLGTDEETML
jgi:hypothetical protein